MPVDAGGRAASCSRLGCRWSRRVTNSPERSRFKPHTRSPAQSPRGPGCADGVGRAGAHPQGALGRGLLPALLGLAGLIPGSRTGGGSRSSLWHVASARVGWGPEEVWGQSRGADVCEKEGSQNSGEPAVVRFPFLPAPPCGTQAHARGSTRWSCSRVVTVQNVACPWQVHNKHR